MHEFVIDSLRWTTKGTARCTIFFGLAVACATPPPTRTIEPTIEPDSGTDDSSFVLSRSSARRAPSDRPDLPIHIEENWWPFRAEHLGISIAEARMRDAAIDRRRPPEGFWDEQTAIEAVSVWSVLCNECH